MPEDREARLVRIKRQSNRTDNEGRSLVDCEDWDTCTALNDPQTLDETKAALEHWREHNYLSGCAHGN